MGDLGDFPVSLVGDCEAAIRADGHPPDFQIVQGVNEVAEVEVRGHSAEDHSIPGRFSGPLHDGQ